MNKLIILLVGIIIGFGAGIGGYMLINHSSKPAATVSSTTNLKTFTSQLVDLSFQYPSSSKYTEKDNFSNQASPAHKGKQVNIEDTTKALPLFTATTTDFGLGDSVTQDFVTGDLTSATSFTVGFTHPKYTQVKELEPGIFLAAGYSPAEGDQSFPVYLFIRPPKNSGLKDVDVYLRDNADQLKPAEQPVDAQGVPIPTDVAIHRIVTLGMDEKSPLIKDTLTQAVIIAKTFTTRVSSEQSNAAKSTYTNTKYGYTFSYPAALHLSSSDGDSTGKAAITPTADSVNVFPTATYVGNAVFSVERPTVTFDAGAIKKLYADIEPSKVEVTTAVVGTRPAYKVVLDVPQNSGIGRTHYYVQSSAGVVLKLWLLVDSAVAQNMLDSFTLK